MPLVTNLYINIAKSEKLHDWSYASAKEKFYPNDRNNMPKFRYSARFKTLISCALQKKSQMIFILWLYTLHRVNMSSRLGRDSTNINFLLVKKCKAVYFSSYQLAFLTCMLAFCSMIFRTIFSLLFKIKPI